jgi:outer membrane protein assembly factor BamB
MLSSHLRPCALLLSAALLACLTVSVSPSASLDSTADVNWPQWRGPSGQGYSTDTAVPLTWGEKENLLWKTRLPGAGNSSPIVWGERVFLTAAGDKGSERLVLCLSTRDGKILWQQTAARNLPAEASHAWNGHASASCATDGTSVFAFFGSGGLFCYDMEGNLRWKHEFGTFVSRTGWGSAASPFLFEDTVIQNCDNDGATAPAAEGKLAPMALVALEKKTGKIRWSTPRNQGQGWSTPRLLPVAGGRIDLVLNGPNGVWGYDPRTGKELWSCKRGGGDQHLFGEPMPVSDNTRMFVLSGRPGPCQAIRLPERGDVTGTHLEWQQVRGKHRDVASPLLHQGKVYVADRGAILSCFDLATGKELYTGTLGSRAAKSLASPVLVRNRILWLLDNGVTAVQEPGDEFKVVARNKLGEGASLEFGASPAIAAGRLYLRSQTHLYCIGEKKE